MLINKISSYIILIFLSSCVNAGDQETMRMDDPLAYKFKFIEGSLQEFAKKHNAKISTVWNKTQSYNPDKSDSFLVKHIVWIDGRFGKAILIQQHDNMNGVDTTAWDFLNLAWLEDTQMKVKPTYLDSLLMKVRFQTIERNIEQLLKTSEKNLSKVKVGDLK